MRHLALGLILCFSVPCWGTSGFSRPILNRYDILELNHTENFTQLIAWQWDYSYCRMDCHFWCMRDKCRMLTPTHWVVGSGVENEVHLVAGDFRETWTEYDPERLNQKKLPDRDRCKPRVK